MALYWSQQHIGHRVAVTAKVIWDPEKESHSPGGHCWKLMRERWNYYRGLEGLGFNCILLRGSKFNSTQLGT